MRKRMLIPLLLLATMSLTSCSFLSKSNRPQPDQLTLRKTIRISNGCEWAQDTKLSEATKRALRAAQDAAQDEKEKRAIRLDRERIARQHKNWLDNCASQ